MMRIYQGIIMWLFLMIFGCGYWGASNPVYAWPTENGIAVCTAADWQIKPLIVTDCQGGAIIVWTDSRNISGYDIYAQSIDSTGAVKWTLDGVAICTVTGWQEYPQLVSDGQGGAIITWKDYRDGFSNPDIYAQAIESSGMTKWTPGGVPICSAIGLQEYPQIILNGQGGTFITWDDYRNGSSNPDIYIQSIDSTGTVMWTLNGIAICTVSSWQLNPRFITNEQGGAIITWQDSRNGLNYDIYAQSINSTGTVQWTPNGTAICTAINIQYNPQLVLDRQGGAIITWQDSRNGGVYFDIYAQAINKNGVVQWTPDGIAICTAAYNQQNPKLVSDGQYGAIITWEDYRYSRYTCDIFAQSINSIGINQWTQNGVAICTESGFQEYPEIVSDGLGGAIITWDDTRKDDGDIYTQAVNNHGNLQWTQNGVAICTSSSDQNDPQLVSDGKGGAIITWWDRRSGSGLDIYAQNIIKHGILPFADFFATPTAGAYPLTVNFYDQSTGNPDSWLWNFGDGSTSTTQNTQYTYSTVGNYTVQLISSNTYGSSTLIRLNYITVNLPPFYATPTSGTYPLTVNFYDQSSWPTIRSWDFGDGGTSSLQNPQYTYITAGKYSVQLISSNGYESYTTIKPYYIHVVKPSNWPIGNGVPICIASNDQINPQIASDDEGGAIIAWTDYRNPVASIGAQAVDVNGATKWVLNGICAAGVANDHLNQKIISDSQGGAVIAYQAKFNAYYDIYAQAIDINSTLKWDPSSGGAPVCRAAYNQKEPQIVSDGNGGAIIIWMDERIVGNSYIYAQAIDSTGIYKWTYNGIQVSTLSGYFPQLVSDGLGGVIITWQDYPNGYFGSSNIYAQAVDSTGTLKWSPGSVAISVISNDQINPQIVPDGQGGVIIAWQDNRNGNDDIYAQAIDSNGILKWTLNGIAVCTASSGQYSPKLVSDGQGGAIITWHDTRNGNFFENVDIYAQAISSSGLLKWNLDGIPISTAPTDQTSPQITSDNQGGAIISWTDSRNGYSDIFAQAIDSSGSMKWALNGVTVCPAPNAQGSLVLVSDYQGGAIIAWEDRRNGNSNPADIYAQGINRNGAVPVELSSFDSEP